MESEIRQVKQWYNDGKQGDDDEGRGEQSPVFQDSVLIAEGVIRTTGYRVPL